MHVRLSTTLPCSFERVKSEIQRVQLLQHVAHPLIRFVAEEPPEFPERWAPGRYVTSVRLFGVIPTGGQIMEVSFPIPAESGEFLVRDNGSGDLASTWDHLVTIRAETPTRTRYTDELRVEAGKLTLLVWLWAQLFFRHRQRRWRKLVTMDFQYAERTTAGG